MLSVPNDAFWPIESPWHKTMWGEGAFEELRRLLPAEHVVAQQVPLQGSAIVPDGHAARSSRPAFAPRDDAVAVALPRRVRAALPASSAARSGASRQADLAAQRRWERQREANLALLRGPHRSWAQRASSATWRDYINELEGELGRPPTDRAARLPVRVAFVVNDLQLSGGVGVVVEHARQLSRRHGFAVDLVLAREQDEPDWRFRGLGDVPVHGMDARARGATTTSSSRPGGRRSARRSSCRRAAHALLRPVARGPLLPAATSRSGSPPR